MINYQFFPRSHGLTNEMAEVVECFRRVDVARTGGKQISSNEMLALVRPHLEKCKYVYSECRPGKES